MSTTSPARTHHRTCNLCEAMCGVTIEVLGDAILSIRGDKDDPFSRGYICPKAAALADLHTDPDRLRHPLRRTSAGFERIGWDEAFAEVTEKIGAIQDQHGKNAVALYLGNPTVHNLGSTLFAAPFAQALGTRNRFSATSVDQLPHHLAALLMFGHQLLLPIPDLDRTDFLLIIGANPAVSNGSLMTAPGAAKRIEAIKARGGAVIVVDPRRTETAALATRHHFIQPGSDAFLLLGVLHTLFAEGRVAIGRLASVIDGLATLEAQVADFPPAKVAALTGIAAEEIEALARAFAGARSAVCYARMGGSTQEFGGLVQWLSSALTIVTGNLDREGGAMFTRPAVDMVDIAARGGQQGHFDRGRSRVRNLPEHGGEYPVAALAEEILTEGPGQIRGLVTVAGNPVLSTPNGKNLDRALAALDFMVSIDFYRNETTRHASIILPPTGPLEHEHYDLVFHLLAIRNTAKYSPALFAPAEDTRHDHQIFQELIARLGARGVAAPLVASVRRSLLRLITPRRFLQLGLRLGPYGRRGPHGRGLTLRALEEQPHGVDLGPLAPCLPGRLFTADKRIALAPKVLVADLDRARARLAASPALSPEGFDLLLIGRRQLRSNNSWMHNSQRLVKGRNRCTVLLHPEDAASRGLAAGARARVSSRVGSIELEVELTSDMMRGVVSIPHGWGHDRPGIALATASAHPGVSVNDLTDERFLDGLTGCAALSGVPVRVESSPA